MADVELFPSTNVLKQELFFIVDFKSLTVLPPFIAQNKEEAKRNFINLLNYSNSTLCKFPEDFRLYSYGEFITAFTGSYDLARQEMEKFVNQFQVVACGDSCIQADTNKYDELSKKIDDALKQVSNSNNVLVEQIGNVPNLDKQINLINSKLIAITDELASIKKSETVDNITIANKSREKFFKNIFS